MTEAARKWKTIVEAISDEDQRRVLERLLNVMTSEGAGRPDQVITHLMDQRTRPLYYCLVDWINAQNSNFFDLLSTLMDSNSVRRWLYDALNRARMDAEFNSVKQRSHVRDLYLTELFSGIEDTEVPVGSINEETGLPNKVDMLYVCSIAKYLRSQNIFEFGTYMGRTTFYLAWCLPHSSVHTLNLPPASSGEYSPYVASYLKRRGSPANIQLIFSDSREFNTEPLKGQMDLIFIDADHSYEMVENDTRKALELLRPGGTIVWHDYAPKTPGVYHFIERFSSDRPVFHIRNTALVVYKDGIDTMAFQVAQMPESLESKFYAQQ
jgi:predicted O-methyltransferase YrrM